MKLVCVQCSCSVVWCRSQERVLMVGAIETRLSDPRLMLVFSTVLDLAWLSWCRITTSKIFPEQIDNIFLVNIFGNEIPQPRSRLRTESCIYAIHRQQQTSSENGSEQVLEIQTVSHGSVCAVCTCLPVSVGQSCGLITGTSRRGSGRCSTQLILHKRSQLVPCHPSNACGPWKFIWS